MYNSTPLPFPDQPLPIILISIRILLNSTGFLLNALLFWLIIQNRKILHKTFSILLTYNLVNDILISTTLLSTLERLIFCHETIVTIYYGPCRYISPKLCYFLSIVHLHALVNWILLQILLISYRTAAIGNSGNFLSVGKTLKYCAVAYIPGFIVMIIPIFYDSFPDNLLQLLGRCSDEDFTRDTYSGFTSFYQSPNLFVISFLLLFNIPHYFLAFGFRYKQNHDLKRNNISMSTLKMHSTLRKVSTIKAFLPLFLLFDVLIYLLCQWGILPNTISEYFLSTISSSINILNPLIVLKCFRPYRRSFLAYYRTVIQKFSPRQIVIFNAGNSEEIVYL